MNSQQDEIEELYSMIEELEEELEELDESSESFSFINDEEVNNEINNKGSKDILFQNTPNPFSTETIIEYQLSQPHQNAQICIYDLTGKQVKCFPINGKQQGLVTLSARELSSGMYLYSLIVGKQIIDTKRMVLTN